jgi:hypothetical protein
VIQRGVRWLIHGRLPLCWPFPCYLLSLSSTQLTCPSCCPPTAAVYFLSPTSCPGSQDGHRPLHRCGCPQLSGQHRVPGGHLQHLRLLRPGAARELEAGACHRCQVRDGRMGGGGGGGGRGFGGLNINHALQGLVPQLQEFLQRPCECHEPPPGCLPSSYHLFYCLRPFAPTTTTPTAVHTAAPNHTPCVQACPAEQPGAALGGGGGAG